MMAKEDSNTGLLRGLEVFAWTARELPIRFFGDEVLWSVCSPIEDHEFGTSAISTIADELLATLSEYREHTGMGRGLAANQIGYTRRIAVVQLGDKPEVLYNPEVVTSEGLGSYWESCISSGAFLVGEVHRPWKATFRYFDADGKEQTLKADENQTRVLLHEIDHLDGITCNDKYEPKTMKLVTGGKDEIVSLPFRQIS
jgi:peptide deformylase